MKLAECGTEEGVNIYALLDNEGLQQALNKYLKICYERATKFGREYVIRRLRTSDMNDDYICIEHVLSDDPCYYSTQYELHFEPDLLPNIPYNTIYTLEEFMKEVNVC